MQEIEAPGIPWAAVSTGDGLWFTIGEGPDDDRFLWRYVSGKGFSPTERIPCPDLTGSYVSYDGEHLYLSQWYKHRILKLDASGKFFARSPLRRDMWPCLCRWLDLRLARDGAGE